MEYVRGLDRGLSLMKSASVSSLGVVVGKEKVSESGRGMYEVWRFVRVFVFGGGRRRVSWRVVGSEKESGDQPRLEEVVTVGEFVVRSTCVQDTEEDSQT